MASTEPVTLCVINYNGEQFLPETLDAALAQEPGFAEALLIDNASTDDGLAVVRERYPAIRIVPLAENRGPGAARNAGLRTATHDRILFVDNDVTLAPGCVRQLGEALDEAHLAAVAMPRVLYADDPERIQYEGATCHYLGLMTPDRADQRVTNADDATRVTGSLISACFLTDRRRLTRVAPFDEDFFIYLEDHDFGLRIRLAGGTLLAVPRAVCRHREGTAGLSLRRTGRYESTRILGHMRNRWIVLLKNCQLQTIIKLSPMLAVYELFQLGGALKKGWWREWTQAVSWTVTHLTPIHRRRRQVQRSRTVRDREILTGGPLPFTEHLARGRLENAARRTLDRLAVSYWRMIRRWLCPPLPST